jgi:hypothetical protein
MNIANIFGLHIGCRARCQFVGNKSSWDVIRRVCEVSGYYIETRSDDGFVTCFGFDRCKLILKPLSAITDEDKAEFMEKFWNYDHFYILEKLDDERVYYKEAGSETIYSRKYFVTEALFLSTKGYKIEGIVPDEYCEVEE